MFKEHRPGRTLENTVQDGILVMRNQKTGQVPKNLARQSEQIYLGSNTVSMT
jgi:hypothetical protein